MAKKSPLRKTQRSCKAALACSSAATGTKSPSIALRRRCRRKLLGSVFGLRFGGTINCCAAGVVESDRQLGWAADRDVVAVDQVNRRLLSSDQSHDHRERHRSDQEWR